MLKQTNFELKEQAKFQNGMIDHSEARPGLSLSILQTKK